MKMMKRETEQRQAIEMLCTDMLVPKEHLLRKIDAAVDFTHIYELVEDLYCEDNGRPGCDPVVLFKLVLIQHLFGIRSLRQTMRDAEVNVAYRWFLGYTMSQSLPHFATISYAFCHRFTAEVIEGVFRWILEEVARAGYLSPEVVFVDGTHIKANANLKKRVKKEIPVAAKRYQEQLDAEIEADRAAHGKKPLKKKDDDDGSTPARRKTVTESTTDPDSGVFGALGHSVSDSDTGLTIPVREGSITDAQIVSVNPGVSGSPGELNGCADLGKVLGSIEMNTAQGIFGQAYVSMDGRMMETGSIAVGTASIVSTINGRDSREYAIEINRIYREADGTHAMLSVTDPELIQKTGGIVQGMSGSPIIQNGKLVGAVTHVFVSDPTKGYAVSIQDMLRAAGIMSKAA